MTPSRLSPSQVQFLALEGGGGSGNAFPGALQALSDPRISVLMYDGHKLVSPIGVAGASAGAVTALLLSCGFDADEIGLLPQIQDFGTFFDDPRPGFVPRVGGFVTLPVDMPKPEVRQLGELALRLALHQLSALPTMAQLAAGKSPWELMEMAILYGTVAVLLESAPLRMKAVLSRNTADYVRSLTSDWGCFPGATAYDFIVRCIMIGHIRVQFGAQLLADPTYSALTKENRLRALFAENSPFSDFVLGKKQAAHLRFSEHLKLFGCQLAVTGTNLETLKTHVFSAATTPDFYVADAVRISMSLPIVFKPYVIRTQEEVNEIAPSLEPALAEDLLGVWADGGLFNNLPIHAFDNEPSIPPPATLGLRLNFDERTPIASLDQLLHQWPFSIGVFGSGESQISRTVITADATISLDTRPVGLLDFAPDKTTLSKIQDVAKAAVLAYFGF